MSFLVSYSSLQSCISQIWPLLAAVSQCLFIFMHVLLPCLSPLFFLSLRLFFSLYPPASLKPKLLHVSFAGLSILLSCLFFPPCSARRVFKCRVLPPESQRTVRIGQNSEERERKTFRVCMLTYIYTLKALEFN